MSASCRRVRTIANTGGASRAGAECARRYKLKNADSLAENREVEWPTAPLTLQISDIRGDVASRGASEHFTKNRRCNSRICSSEIPFFLIAVAPPSYA
jgi:hypothetical protein